MTDPVKKSALERFGISGLKRVQRGPVHADDEVHVLNERERAELRRLERGGVVRAGLAGALSAGLSVAAGIVGTRAGLEGLRYWGFFGAVTLVASLFEFAFLYWDGARTVGLMASEAGLGLADASLDERIVVGLARAALEIPHPPESCLGVHAYQESSRVAIFLRSAVYKAKITVTNFLLKTLVQRALGKVAMRFYVDVLVAIPVTALWNAVVARRIYREARLCIVGSTSAPVLVSRLHGAELRSVPSDDVAARGELALRAVACVTVSSERVHPNVEAFATELGILHRHVRPGPDLGSTNLFLEKFATASAEAQRYAFRAAVAAAMLDGVLTRRESLLLESLAEKAGLARLDMPELTLLARNLRHGGGLDEERLSRLLALDAPLAASA